MVTELILLLYSLIEFKRDRAIGLVTDSDFVTKISLLLSLVLVKEREII